jgi:hypothetical protein
MPNCPDPSMLWGPIPMNERLRPYAPRPAANMPVEPADRPLSLPRPSLPQRLLGWMLLMASVGLVSCQSLFVP